MNPQRELAALIGPSAFVRRAKTDDALYISDAPRRLPPEALILLEETLNKNEFCCRITNRGLWEIDLADERLLALLHSYPHGSNPKIPKDNALLPAYALIRLLQKHPAPWAKQPRGPIRAILKRMNLSQAEMNPVLQPLLETCAERLRKGLPLPSEAATALMDWLKRME
ncbi:MAG: hypothetical protein PHY64_11350 [Eubacteriales bacterium]|nr:hypothetical protein [Eubacteriales bacterium]